VGKYCGGDKILSPPVVSTLRGQAPLSPPPFRRLCSEVTVNSLGNPCTGSKSEEERKATVGRICRKVRVSDWNEGVRGD